MLLTTTLANTPRASADAQPAWMGAPGNTLKGVRSRLILKHGSLTKAAVVLAVPYLRLSHAMNGREYLAWIVAAIQKDLRLTDAQVLACWPLLRRWPRPDLEERAARRAG